MIFRRSFSAGSKTFYEILQVSHDSNLTEIKSQYYKLCKLLHPDTKTLNSKGESTEFHDILKAYETLKDPAKRREYDRSLALIQFKGTETSLKDFKFKRKVDGNFKNESMKFWSKIAASGRKEKSEPDNLQERLEDIRVFRNRIIVIGTILIGYWISTFRSK